MGLSGNHKLYGNNGSDTLIGGAGNDYLEGGNQGDTYIFAKGHGQDTVYDYSYEADENDTVRFTDVASTEVKFRKNGSNLTVYGYNSDDSVTIKDFFSSSYARIEHFEFQDGILSNPDFARFSQMANNLGQAMSVFGVQAVSSENSNAPADLSTKPILTLSPLS
ncbi:calcium-binding protein [Kingella oralis]|nr:calcium-binding protein [Kingella oralis]